VRRRFCQKTAKRFCFLPICAYNIDTFLAKKNSKTPENMSFERLLPAGMYTFFAKMADTERASLFPQLLRGLCALNAHLRFFLNAAQTTQKMPV
jgi:hypothetical protein